MARPLRFRKAPGGWTRDRVRGQLYESLERNLGATSRSTWYRQPAGYDATRFEMDNGDVALFCWNADAGYWIGNTETPSALWRTEKHGFDEVPEAVSRWAQRELLAQLYEESPRFEAYPHLAEFFLPVLLSKDGRHTTRAFFLEHGAGFPDADPDRGMAFYDAFLGTGALDDYRYLMAAKLGTSDTVDPGRMEATMAEFNVAKLLHDAGYEVTPEASVSTGHSIDFRADPVGVLVEVTRPLPPPRRSADSPITAIRETVETKTGGQLSAHGGGIVLFVDCSSFSERAWEVIRSDEPSVGHRPAIVVRLRPDGDVDGYVDGTSPLELPDLSPD